MDPRMYFRVSVAALALRIPLASKPARSGVHSILSPCYCEIQLPGFPTHTVPVLLLTPSKPPPASHSVAASFYLDEPALCKLFSTGIRRSSKRCLDITVYTGRQGSSCGIRAGKMLGKFVLPVGVEWAVSKPVHLHHGWVSIGKPKSDGSQPGSELHLIVKIEPDPRYIFQFDGEPELSPQIFQIKGNARQPIFSCKFTRDRCSRSRIGSFDCSSGSGWATSYQGEKEKERKERKGWLIIIHDLSGSPVAAASMITPFVPSGGSDRVTRSNPGCWLILRPGPVGEDSWRPWGRLQAWRERGNRGMGCKVQLADEAGGLCGMGSDILVSESVIDTHKGGKFTIDTAKLRHDSPHSCSPVESPRSSGDFYFSIGAPFVGGFVMSSDIEGEGKHSKPQVQLAMRHVTCMEDAAVFMALAAAVDLSMDACLPFSKKLGKTFTETDRFF